MIPINCKIINFSICLWRALNYYLAESAASTSHFQPTNLSYGFSGYSYRLDFFTNQCYIVQRCAFCQPQQLQCLHHGFIKAYLCSPHSFLHYHIGDNLWHVHYGFSAGTSYAFFLECFFSKYLETNCSHAPWSSNINAFSTKISGGSPKIETPLSN